MAINFLDVSRSLVIVVKTGVTEGGKDITKSYSFKGISETASAEQIKQAADALASLMAGEVVGYYIKDTNEVLEIA